MYTVKTKWLCVMHELGDLDAIELITLARIFQSARDHVTTTLLLRTLDKESGEPLRDELTSLAMDAQLSAAARCRSISSATDMLIHMPSKSEWQREKERSQ